MKRPCRRDIESPFGEATIEQVAATLYNMTHGECECCSHPFYPVDSEDFHGVLPWEEGRPNFDDAVVQAYRRAARAARSSLMNDRIGHFIDEDGML